MITQFLVRYCVSSLDFSENVNVTQYIVGKKKFAGKKWRNFWQVTKFFVKWYIVKVFQRGIFGSSWVKNPIQTLNRFQV